MPALLLDTNILLRTTSTRIHEISLIEWDGPLQVIDARS